MIKIQSQSYPLIWQIDHSYNLPGITGQVRWNGLDKRFEVCDNSGMWHKIDNTIHITQDPAIQDVINWAKEKISEEKKLAEMIDKYPVVKDAKEKLDIILALVKEEIKA